VFVRGRKQWKTDRKFAFFILFDCARNWIDEMFISYSFIAVFANHTVCIDASGGTVLYMGTLLKTSFVRARVCVLT
jgi:hypothetical protein